MRGNGRGRTGTPRVGSHHMSEIVKNSLTAKLISLVGSGDGNTNICPGRQTPSRRHALINSFQQPWTVRHRLVNE